MDALLFRFQSTLFLLLLGFVPLNAQGPDLAELQQLAQRTEGQQRQAANQRRLTDWFLGRVQAFQQVLQGTAIGSQIRLGDPAASRRLMALNGGAADFILVWRRQTGGPTKNPGEPFYFPNDAVAAYAVPASIATQSTCWHELQHGILAAHALSTPGWHGADQEHVYIESYAEFTIQWLYNLLNRGQFEARIRQAHADLEEYQRRGSRVGYEEERAIWSRANEAWRQNWDEARKILALEETLRAEYERLAGVRVPSVEEVIRFYMEGGVRGTRGTTLRVPEWVLQHEHLRAPVTLDHDRNSARADSDKGMLFQHFDFSLRSLTRNPANRMWRRQPVSRGELVVKLESEDEAATLSLRLGNRKLEGASGPGGPSLRRFVLDLGTLRTELERGDTFRVSFVHRRPGELKGNTSFRIAVEYLDRSLPGNPAIYDVAKSLFWVDAKGGSGSIVSKSGGKSGGTSGSASGSGSSSYCAVSFRLSGDAQYSGPIDKAHWHFDGGSRRHVTLEFAKLQIGCGGIGGRFSGRFSNDYQNYSASGTVSGRILQEGTFELRRNYSHHPLKMVETWKVKVKNVPNIQDGFDALTVDPNWFYIEGVDWKKRVGQSLEPYVESVEQEFSYSDGKKIVLERMNLTGRWNPSYEKDTGMGVLFRQQPGVEIRFEQSGAGPTAPPPPPKDPPMSLSLRHSLPPAAKEDPRMDEAPPKEGEVKPITVKPRKDPAPPKEQALWYRHPEGLYRIRLEKGWTQMAQSPVQDLDALGRSGQDLPLLLCGQGHTATSDALAKAREISSGWAAKNRNSKAFQLLIHGIPAQVVGLASQSQGKALRLWHIALPLKGKLVYFAVWGKAEWPLETLPQEIQSLLEGMEMGSPP